MNIAKTVFITRPIRFAAALAGRLEAAGYACWIEPLLVFEPLPCVKPAGAFAATILSSQLGLDALIGRDKDVAPLLAKPCYAVGERTAYAARAFGFRDVRDGGGDGEALAARILGEGGQSFLHIGGDILDPKGRDLLLHAGRRVEDWTVYRAAPCERFSEDFTERLQRGEAFDAALFFSRRTAQTYRQIAESSGLSLCGAKALAIGLSAAVVEALAPLPWRELCAASAPTEEATLARLIEKCPP